MKRFGLLGLLGLFFLLLGFVEIAAIFGCAFMILPVPACFSNLSIENLSVLLLASPFVFIILGSFIFGEDHHNLLTRKQKGLCWNCGTDIKNAPEYKCPSCGNEHDKRIIQLYIEIGKRQQQLRELNDG